MENKFKIGDIVKHKLTNHRLIVVKFYKNNLVNCRYFDEVVRIYRTFNFDYRELEIVDISKVHCDDFFKYKSEETKTEFGTIYTFTGEANYLEKDSCETSKKRGHWIEQEKGDFPDFCAVYRYYENKS